MYSLFEKQYFSFYIINHLVIIEDIYEKRGQNMFYCVNRAGVNFSSEHLMTLILT